MAVGFIFETFTASKEHSVFNVARSFSGDLANREGRICYILCYHEVSILNYIFIFVEELINNAYFLMLYFPRFNLVQLFLQSAQSDRLRKLIVDAEVSLISFFNCSSIGGLIFNVLLTKAVLQAPRFDGGSILSQDPAISYIWSEKNLNADQRRAIIKVDFIFGWSFSLLFLCRHTNPSEF